MIEKSPVGYKLYETTKMYGIFINKGGSDVELMFVTPHEDIALDFIDTYNNLQDKMSINLYFAYYEEVKVKLR